MSVREARLPAEEPAILSFITGLQDFEAAFEPNRRRDPAFAADHWRDAQHRCAQKHGIMLILESMNIRNDHKGHCLWGSPDAVRICREVASPFVKINWDLYHMQISEGDLCRRLREGWDQVGYIQVADNPGRMEPGTGEIAYARVYRELRELGYAKPIGVECNPSGDPTESAVRLAQSDVWT